MSTQTQNNTWVSHYDVKVTHPYSVIVEFEEEEPDFLILQPNGSEGIYVTVDIDSINGETITDHFWVNKELKIKVDFADTDQIEIFV